MIGIAFYDENPGSLLMYEQKIMKSFKNRGFEFEFIKYKSIKSLQTQLKNEPERFEIIIFNLATNKLSGIKMANEIRKVNDKLSIIFIAESYDFVYDAIFIGSKPVFNSRYR